MSINIPFTRLTLSIELFSEEVRKIDDEKLADIIEEHTHLMPGDKRVLLKMVADENGIDERTLINSPNYEVLMEEYGEKVFLRIVNRIREEFNLSRIQAWAVFAQVSGLLDDPVDS